MLSRRICFNLFCKVGNFREKSNNMYFDTKSLPLPELLTETEVLTVIEARLKATHQCKKLPNAKDF